MKIGITGHTRGLGKSLFDHYQSLGHECVGYSRTNGYDVVADSDRIISQARDFDLFINNANDGDAQTKFVTGLSQYPVDIVSMGTSSAVNYLERQHEYSGWKKDYLHNKYLLLETHRQMVHSSLGSLLLLNLEALENHPTSQNTIRFSEIHDIIDFWLQHKNISTVNYAVKAS